jgi:hypothetical protein
MKAKSLAPVRSQPGQPFQHEIQKARVGILALGCNDLKFCVGIIAVASFI